MMHANIMSFFSRKTKPSRPTATIVPPRIEFVGEQTGRVEDELKSKFRDVFAQVSTVASAYLARLSYDDPSSYSVGLCIRSTRGEDASLEKVLGQIFTDMFRRDEYLDILFIS